MLTDRQIFQLIGFDTDAMEKYKYSESNAVLSPYLNCDLSLISHVGYSGHASNMKGKLSKDPGLVEKDICRKWSLRQREFLNNSLSNAVLGG